MSSRRGRRGMRRGSGRGGPSLSDSDNSWRSSGSVSQPPSQQNVGRGQSIERNASRGRITTTANELAESEKLFADLNRDVKSAVDLFCGLNLYEKFDRLLSNSIIKLNGLTISWSNQVEDFVIFLKRLLIVRDERFLGLHYFVPLDSTDSDDVERVRLCEKFPGKASQLLQVICKGLLPGKDSYSLLHTLVNKTSSNSYGLAQLFGFKTTASTNEELKLHSSLPYTELVDVLTNIIVKSKGVLAFAERKSLFASHGGSYTSFSQDIAFILENLIHLTMKLIMSNQTDHHQKLNQGRTWMLLMKMAEATPFNRLPPTLLHSLCRFVDELYQSDGSGQLSGLSRGVLSVLMQNEGVRLDDLKSVFEVKEIHLDDVEIRAAFKSGSHNVSGASIFQDFLQYLKTALSKLDGYEKYDDSYLIGTSPVSEYMQIFTGLAKYHFKESLETCRNIFYITAPILRRAGRIEQLLRVIGFQGAILEEQIDKSLPGITLKFIGGLMTAVSEYVKDEFDGEYVSSIGEQWFSIMQIFPGILDLGSWTLGCLALDSMSAVKEDLFSRLSVEAQEKTLSFVVKVGVMEKHRPEIRGKCGRCLALMFDFQMLVEQSEPLWFTLNCIGKSLNSEHLQVRTSWAWALGKWSDALEKHHTNGEMPTELENSVLHVLKLIHICSKDVLKIRYNGYRTAANVFKWMPDAALEFPKVRLEISNTIDSLISQIGHGVDYKARWNAVYAVGCVYENTSIMSEMGSAILTQSLPCLWTWIAQSQNYKERIQCAVAIRKIQSRGLFKEHYHTVWHRVCLSVTRLPVEDIDLAQKLKCEIAITLAELVSLMEPKDLSGMEQILSEHSGSLKTLFFDTQKMIPSERKECINRARDRVMSLRPHQSSDTVIDTLCEILCDYSLDDESVD